MSQLSPAARDLIRVVVAAFCPVQAPLAPARIAARGIQFLEDLIQNGSSGTDQIQLLLTMLDVALAGVDRGNREAVRSRLTDLEKGHGLANIAPKVTRGLARFAQRLAVFLAYATLDETNRPPLALALGYEIFPDRPRGAEALIPQEAFLPEEVWVKPEAKLPDRVFDVVVVGSGSGGAVVARRLVEDHGLDVALLEAGDYVPESWTLFAPSGAQRPFPWDEIENLRRYYKNGGLQLTQGISMFIFQGECLGGSSVVNNAVCFRMNDETSAEWSSEFGIPWSGAELSAAYTRIAADLGIGPAEALVDKKPGSNETWLNPSGRFLRSGAARTGLPPDALKPCDVNLSHDPLCLGCGYCNLVCGYLRKRTVLQTMLPAACTSAAAGRGRLTVLTGRRAIALDGDEGETPFRARAVLVRRRTGGPTRRLRAKQIVVAAGAIASSGLLQRSPGIAAIGLPIGERFSFNFGSPVHADFDEEVRAFDGLQIAHYYRPPSGVPFVVETWFNPPATQSLALPGWMDDLAANVSRYGHLACAAPLVGSTAKSSIRVPLFGHGEEIRVELDEHVDLPRLKDGLKTISRLFFNADPAPRRVLIGALDRWEVTKANFEARIDEIGSFDEIQIGTGHPQGGNCLAAVAGFDGGPGVVGVDFRVHGTANVFVADASVFPTSLGVNPHWTIMAVAELAAKRVSGLA